MDIDLSYAGREVARDPDDEERRYRFGLGGQEIFAVMTAPSVNVWRQAHPGAGDDELDEWAVARGERAIRAQLERNPLDVSDVAIDHDVGGGERSDRPKYGEGDHPHR